MITRYRIRIKISLISAAMQWMQLTVIEDDDRTGADYVDAMSRDRRVGELYYLRWA